MPERVSGRLAKRKPPCEKELSWKVELTLKLKGKGESEKGGRAGSNVYFSDRTKIGSEGTGRASEV